MSDRREILLKKIRAIVGETFIDTPWWSRSEGGAVKTRTKRNMERLDIHHERQRREQLKRYFTV